MIETRRHVEVAVGRLEIRRVGFESMAVIARMNRDVFDEERIINRFDRPDLMMLLAFFDGEPAGFKIGYGLPKRCYYSAKGGVLSTFRRRGIARTLLGDMMKRARSMDYARFAFDTFPNIHVGMTKMAIDEGFILETADFSEGFGDYRLRFVKPL